LKQATGKPDLPRRIPPGPENRKHHPPDRQDGWRAFCFSGKNERSRRAPQPPAAPRERT